MERSSTRIMAVLALATNAVWCADVPKADTSQQKHEDDPILTGWNWNREGFYDSCQKYGVTIEVSSGGVALGSYQGGYLLGRTLKYTKSDTSTPRILTGASAGAINTLGGLYHSFHPRWDSLGYSPYAEWLKIDWKTLSGGVPGDAPLSLLDTGAIQNAIEHVVDKLLERPDSIAKNVQAQVGFAITRFLPEEVYKDLDVRSAAEKIVVRMRWLEKCPDPARRDGGCYQVWTTGFGDKMASDRRRVNQLWFGRYGTDESLIRQNLVSLARASSSFPLAFPPARLPILTYTSKDPNGTARYAGNFRASLAWAKCFEDTIASRANCHWSGYVMSNGKREYLDTLNMPADTSKQGPDVSKPVDSIVLLYKGANPTDTVSFTFSSKIDSAHGRWNKDGRAVKFSDGGMFENQPLELAMSIFEHPSSVGPKPYVRAIRMLSPTHYPLEQRSPRIARSMSAEWFLMLQRNPDPTSQELLRALERRNVNPSYIELNTTSLPLASEHAIHFSGFFEERFRRFDFLVGFLDAFDSTKGSGSAIEDLPSLRKAIDSIGSSRIPEVAWMLEVLRTIDSANPKKSLFFEARRLSMELQRKANDSLPSEDELVRLEVLQKKILKEIGRLYGEGNQAALGNLDQIELLEVLYGSLERLHGTLETIRDGDTETDGDRYANFRKGLERSSPCPRMTVKGITKVCYEQSKKPSSDINDVYLQMARFMDKDAFGLGNSFVYPAGTFLARPLVGFMVGQKPRWSPPYMRIESSNSGFLVLQGFSMVPRSARSLQAPPLDLLRWEFGLHTTWNASSSQQWLPIRAGIEIPFGSIVSIFPSWTYSVPLSDSTRNPRLGLDIVGLDLVHLRIEPRIGTLFDEVPDIFAGIRFGWDPFAIAEGFMNGTNKDRRLDRRKE